MKSQTYLVLLLSILGFIALGGCSKDSQSSANNTAGNCSSGNVYSSQYGTCLAQGSCQAGYAVYNNSCVPVVNTGSSACGVGYAYSGTSCVYTGSTSNISCPSGTVAYGNSCVANSSYATNSCQGSCQPGYNQTAYGCYPQYACQSCYGYSQGYCANAQGAWYYLGY